MLDNIRVVMVETQTPGNIGAAARAMKTMGLSRLVLVNPLDFPAQKAIWRSAGAADVVERAQVVSSLEEALESCVLVVAASARQRRIPWPMLSPEESAIKSCQTAQQGNQVAFVFGREDRGLVNEELQLCNYHSAIPANEVYPVLNVAAAVQVFCYEIHKAMLPLISNSNNDDLSPANSVPASKSRNPQNKTQGKGTIVEDLMLHATPLDNWDEDFASHENIERFYQHLEKVLVDLDFHDPQNPRQLMTRLRRLFNRTQLDVMELNILRGVLTAVEKSNKS